MDLTHTCSRCQYEAVPDNKYPCNQCTWSKDIRQDLWTQKKTSHKAHWMHIGDKDFWSDMIICRCSECKYKVGFTGKFDGRQLTIDPERAYKYCPNCGADMRRESEDNE